MKSPFLAALIVASRLTVPWRPKPCRGAVPKRKASRPPRSSVSSRRPTRTSTRSTVSCSFATAMSWPRVGGRPIAPSRRTLFIRCPRASRRPPWDWPIAEGKLSVDDEVLKFFPDDAPAEPSKNLKAMRSATCCACRPDTRTSRNARRRRPGPRRSSLSQFLSSPAPISSTTRRRPTCSRRLCKRRPAMTLLDYLKPRLFEPLGIEHPTWETSPQGISTGGLRAVASAPKTSRGLASSTCKRGGGTASNWCPRPGSKPRPPARPSNGSSPNSDWDQGYGYQFWRCRHGAYRGDGAFGQYCIVMPEQDAVIAITSGVKDMQARTESGMGQAAPGHDAGSAGDRRRVAQEARAGAGELDDSPRRRFSARPSKAGEQDLPVSRPTIASWNRSRSRPTTRADAVTLVAKIAGVEQKIACGRGEWQKGRVAYGMLADHPAAVSGAWTADDTYTAKDLLLRDAVYRRHMNLKFDGDRLLVDSRSNVGFGPSQPAQLVGSPAEK